MNYTLRISYSFITYTNIFPYRAVPWHKSITRTLYRTEGPCKCSGLHQASLVKRLEKVDNAWTSDMRQSRLVHCICLTTHCSLSVWQQFANSFLVVLVIILKHDVMLWSSKPFWTLWIAPIIILTQHRNEIPLSMQFKN